MKYPQFLRTNDTIGISAPSSGVGEKIDSFNASLDTLHRQGYYTKETASVRNPDARSASAFVRGQELTSLFSDTDVNMVMCAAGGDFLIETLEHIDFETLAAHPKWYMGASDPTSILYCYTTKYDVATIYGLNAGSYDLGEDFDYVHTNLEYLKGNLIPQQTYPMCLPKAKFMVEEIAYDTPDEWYSNKETFHVRGRCIGGCIDVLKDLIGTPYEDTLGFVERYKEDGTIFYFDNFSMSAEMFYRTLLQFKYAGWFRYTKAVLLGRVLFESSETGMDYAEALHLALQDMPYIYCADIGHTIPAMTLINGAMVDVDFADNAGTLTFTLQ